MNYESTTLQTTKFFNHFLVPMIPISTSISSEPFCILFEYVRSIVASIHRPASSIDLRSADFAFRERLWSEMANRANKPNRTFLKSCSVCSSSASFRTLISLFGSCSASSSYTKQSRRPREGWVYLTGKWIQWGSGSIWTSVERSKGETEGRAQKRQEKEDEGHRITCITVSRIKL